MWTSPLLPLELRRLRRLFQFKFREAMRLYLIQKRVDNFHNFSAWDQRTHFPSLQPSIRSFRPRFNWVKSCSAEFTKTMGSQRGLRTFKWKSHLGSRFKLSTRQASAWILGDFCFCLGGEVNGIKRDHGLCGWMKSNMDELWLPTKRVSVERKVAQPASL